MPRKVARRKLEADVVEKPEEQIETTEPDPDQQEKASRPKRGRKRRSDVGVNDNDEAVPRNGFTKPPNEKKSNRKENKEHCSETDDNPANDFFDECKKLFNTSCLYEVLNVESNASSGDIRKAYYKTALKYHPDKHQNSNDQEDMASKFKVVCHAYQILSDSNRRKVYDEIGSLTAFEFATRSSDLMFIFEQITTDEIEGFLQGYRNSEEEKSDLLECYKQYKGDWNEISNRHMSYSLEHEERLKSIVQEAIDKKDIEDYGPEPVKRMKARHRRLAKEQIMAEKKSKALSMKDLEQTVRERQERRAKDLSVKLNDILKASGSRRAAKARQVTDGPAEKNEDNVAQASGCRSRRAAKNEKQETEENVIKTSGCRSRRAATKVAKAADCENEEHVEATAAPANKRAKRGKQC